MVRRARRVLVRSRATAGIAQDFGHANEGAVDLWRHCEQRGGGKARAGFVGVEAVGLLGDVGHRLVRAEVEGAEAIDVGDDGGKVRGEGREALLGNIEAGKARDASNGLDGHRWVWCVRGLVGA